MCLEVERCIKHGSCFVPVIFSHRLPRVMKAFLPLVIVCAVGTVSGFPRLSRPQQHNGVQYEGPMKDAEYGLENLQSKEEFEIKTADTLPWKMRNPGGPGKYQSDGLENVQSEEEFELKTADTLPWKMRNPGGPGKYLNDGLENVEIEEEFELKTADTLPWKMRNPGGPGKYQSDGLENVQSEEEFELKTADKLPSTKRNRNGPMQMGYANANLDSEEDSEARDSI